MRKSTASSLLAILSLALVLRLSPLLRFVYFGSDVGEYLAISRGLLGTGHVSLAYAGWGVTYPYFPGMYFLVAGTTAMGGLETSGALNLVVPALGALAPALVFLVAARVLHEDKAAVLAAALVAVAMPHAFQTAHPIPAVVGEVLALAAVLLFLRLPADPRTWALLVPLTGALVVTHHLSAYFLIVMLLTALIVRSVVSPAPLPGARVQALYIAFLAGLSLAFWLLYAAPFREDILTDVDVDPWWLPIVALPALVAALGGVVLLRRRAPWRYRPRYPDRRHVALALIAAFAATEGVMALSAVTGVPGTAIRLPPVALAYFLPLFAFVALAGAGRRHMDFAGRGLDVSGWFLALVLSVLFGFAVAPRVLIPYRHVEYLVLVLALPAGAGFSRLVELSDLGRRRLLASGAAALLVAGTALSAFPPTGVLVNYEEGARPPAVDASYWAGENVDGLLATDHRASTLAFGLGGVDATWDTARLAILAPDFASARAEMCAVDAPSGVARVDYVLIDRDLEAGVQLSPFEPAIPLDPAARAKFLDAPYQTLYDNGFAQVYVVNWGLAGAACP